MDHHNVDRYVYLVDLLIDNSRMLIFQESLVGATEVIRTDMVFRN